MQAFHNDATIKSAIMTGLAAHRAADELVQGSYWENGKGCAVGCTLETIRVMKGDIIIDHSSHALAENETGIPRILWRIEDCIFEGLPNAAAKDWPEQFTDAIRPGADLTMIWPRFALWLLTEELQFTKRAASTAALAEVAAMYREWCESGKNPNRERWIGARKNAADAYAAAADAAADASAYADDVVSAYAASADDDDVASAYAAADVASAYAADAASAYVAYAASAYAADVASADDADVAYAYAVSAYAADAASAVFAAVFAARHAAYGRQVAKLIELLKAA